MNWKAIEQAILAYAVDKGLNEDVEFDDHGNYIVEVPREQREINISELARAIDKAITVKVD